MFGEKELLFWVIILLSLFGSHERVFCQRKFHAGVSDARQWTLVPLLYEAMEAVDLIRTWRLPLRTKSQGRVGQGRAWQHRDTDVGWGNWML